jgi:hypothetical protein
MGNTQKERLAAHALPRATLIVAQAQLLDFIEIDFDLEAARISMDGFHGLKGEARTEQIKAREQALRR